MENFFSRYKNPLALMAVLFIQVVALATQVKRPENARAGNTGSGTRLIRVWTVSAVSPVERSGAWGIGKIRDAWRHYFALSDTARQNEERQGGGGPATCRS